MMSEWIDCDVKLPFTKHETGVYRSQSVIITDGVFVCEGEFIGGNGNDNPWAMWSPYNNIKQQDIVYWMPMPVGPWDNK